MDRLPLELVDHTYTFLSIKWTKDLRLACRSFAEIGEKHLFHDFEFRVYPQLSRSSQLKQLSLHPTIAPRLKCLCYESGVQLEYDDYRYWKAQVDQSEANNFSRGITSDGKSWEDYRRFHKALEAPFTPDLGERYEQHRRWLDCQAKTMAYSTEIRDVFASVLSNCHALTTVKIHQSEPEITLDDLAIHASNNHQYTTTDNLQSSSRVKQRKSYCLRHFMSLLIAVYSSGRIINELVAVDLPRVVLEKAQREAGMVNGVFRSLQKLDLTISELPRSHRLAYSRNMSYFRRHGTAPMALRKLLNVPRDLQQLSLCFPSGREAAFSTDIFDRMDLVRFPRKWLHGLKQLRLANFLCAWPDLNGLLREAKELKSLTLRAAAMERGSMIWLLATLRELGLADVCLDGRWKVQDDGGEWHSHDEEQFYHCEQYDGPYAVTGVRSKIEAYIVRGGSCPLPSWTPDGHEDGMWESGGDTSWHYIPQKLIA